MCVYFLIELGREREKKKKIHSQRRALTSEKVHLRDEQKTESTTSDIKLINSVTYY